MLSADCPFEVARTKGSDEVPAPAANLPNGRVASETANWTSPRAPNPSPSSSQSDTDAAVDSSKRHVLPSDLSTALTLLYDQELERLQAAVLAEQRRRGRRPAESVELWDKRRIEAVTVHLTPGKLNAVRAAFKAGVKPSQIARQFGLSQADVRKALASDSSKRAPNYDSMNPSRMSLLTVFLMVPPLVSDASSIAPSGCCAAAESITSWVSVSLFFGMVGSFFG
jgi:hypothetical protein